jgi:hypothetical protein
MFLQYVQPKYLPAAGWYDMILTVLVYLNLLGVCMHGRSLPVRNDYVEFWEDMGRQLYLPSVLKLLSPH